MITNAEKRLKQLWVSDKIKKYVNSDNIRKLANYKDQNYAYYHKEIKILMTNDVWKTLNISK